MQNRIIRSNGCFKSYFNSPANIHKKESRRSQRLRTIQTARFANKQPHIRVKNRATPPVFSRPKKISTMQKCFALFCLFLITSSELLHIYQQLPKSNTTKKRFVKHNRTMPNNPPPLNAASCKYHSPTHNTDH